MNPYQDPSVPIENRVSDLIARMSLREKIGQLNQVFATDKTEMELLPLIREGGAGSRILASSWHAGSDEDQQFAYEALHECQRVAVEESRLGIPLIFARDVIHGHLTIFPIPLAQAASWNPSIVQQAARIAAREAAADYVHWTLAPMLDVARDPRWGRVIEGCGEDPWLCGQMAKAMVRGFQGDNLRDPDAVLSCAKHFAGYGAAEGGRDYNTVEISENTLRNVYLPPFQAALEEGVGSVMCAFHDLNGTPCTTHRFLLKQVLRQEWGFAGIVISDWDSIKDTVLHGTAEDQADAASQAIKVGVDMEMVDACYRGNLEKLVGDGRVEESCIDEAVARILHAKFSLGLFERPYTPNGGQQAVHLLPEHLDCAYQLAVESAVLLKNEAGILPIECEAAGRVALIGPLCQAQRELLGNWTLDGRASDVTSIQNAMTDVMPDLLVCDAGAPADTQLRRARAADTVIIVVGEDHQRNGENANVAELALPPGQEELVAAVHALGKKIILVVCAGRPLVMTRIEPMASAILWMWHPGTEGGKAAVDLLVGKVVPSGKLPITFPRATGQVPIYYNYKRTCRPVDDYYGKDSRYLDLPGRPLYPFGFGLSYTQFSYSDFKLDAESVDFGGSVTASVMVTNTGMRAGDEIVQCYVRDDCASTTRPVRELKGFHKLHLEPGQSERVEFRLGEQELGFYGDEQRWVVEAGTFHVWIGADSTATLGGTFRMG